MNNPEFAKVGNRKYKINTDFRVAIECNDIAQDETIDDVERSLAIIYKLYGEEGLKHQDDYVKLLEIAVKYLQCGVDIDSSSSEEPNMDLKQDYRLIQASFKSDYGIVLEQENMHWWDFMAYLNGLTDKCVLSRVRDLRDMNIAKITDAKDKENVIKLKEKFSLKKHNVTPLTQEENNNIDQFYKLMGLERGE